MTNDEIIKSLPISEQKEIKRLTKGIIMNEIKFDKRNYRKHNDKNKELINKSLKECGAGRSIVIDAENEIIAGNGIYEQAQKLNIPTKIIETDGSELVVVKRTDLKTDDDKRKQLAVMDNSTSDIAEFNSDDLQADFDIEQLNDWGIDLEFETLEPEYEDEPNMALIEKKLLKCPECGHINEEKAFRNYENS